eukprot:2209366-Rhodomonas_salina.2
MPRVSTEHGLRNAHGELPQTGIAKGSSTRFEAKAPGESKEHLSLTYCSAGASASDDRGQDTSGDERANGLGAAIKVIAELAGASRHCVAAHSHPLRSREVKNLVEGPARRSAGRVAREHVGIKPGRWGGKGGRRGGELLATILAAGRDGEGGRGIGSKQSMIISPFPGVLPPPEFSPRSAIPLWPTSPIISIFHFCHDQAGSSLSSTPPRQTAGATEGDM